MTRIKICGITRLQDALKAVSLGVDALGFVFYAPSKRAIEIDRAAQIISALPPFVTTTALFVDADAETVKRVARETAVDLLQFHGHESNEFCAGFERPFIKALRMRPDVDIEREIAAYPSARGILLDAYRKGVPGGTGETFDWKAIPESLHGSITLAGGLKPENVEQAILTVAPFAVDVSGGVESAAGIKDESLLERFVGEVRRADQTRASLGYWA